ncbi:MAG: chitobiase/beta-hexosaminidase C-terminal domain-containing protein, partial [Bacteroidetes bacterium]|nr:chitobiase/beta-hexosaminidase C-terminal domain-containing protein [Bacteroidota bacterium]
MANKSQAQLVINELQGLNLGNVVDEDGEAHTWVELYNNTPNDINLSHYQLTDKSNQLNKWTFPLYILKSYNRILVFTSSKNRKLLVDHWETPVWYNNVWKYFVGKTAPSASWKDVAFNDSLWLNGKGGIGNGDNDDSTIIAKTLSLYMRQKFDLVDTAKIANMILSMDYDDGFIAYLNGKEIARVNMANSAYNDSATAGHEALMYQGQYPEMFSVNDSIRKYLRLKNNVLAIQVHNNTIASSDLSAIPFLSFGVADTATWYQKRNMPWLPSFAQSYFHTNFKLSRNETLVLTDDKGNIVDSQNTGYLDSIYIKARIPDGNNWCITSTPTPNQSNNNQVCYNGLASPPQFSLKAGFYKGVQALALTSSNPACVIRYTDNGNTPDRNSKLYTSKIVLTKSKVIKAICYDTTLKQLPSKIVTNTYFMNESITLPVVSISTDSSNLWDYYSGIYVYGPYADSVNFPYFGSNFWNEWEKPAHIEYFKPTKWGNQLFELDANISIQGNYSKGYPQKSFRVETRKELDSSYINYPLWPNRHYTDVKNFHIRNAGIDWSGCHMRDDAMHRAADNTNIDIMETQACVLFLNGAY